MYDDDGWQDVEFLPIYYTQYVKVCEFLEAILIEAIHSGSLDIPASLNGTPQPKNVPKTGGEHPGNWLVERGPFFVYLVSGHYKVKRARRGKAVIA